MCYLQLDTVSMRAMTKALQTNLYGKFRYNL